MLFEPDNFHPFQDAPDGVGDPAVVRVPAFVEAFADAAIPLAESLAVKAFLVRVAAGDLRARFVNSILARVEIHEPNNRILQVLQFRLARLWKLYGSCDSEELLKIMETIYP